MYRTKTKAVRRVAIAGTLGLGLVSGIAGIAAADNGSTTTSQDSTTTTTVPIGQVVGIVTGYVASTSISVLSTGSVTPSTYALTGATTISGLLAGATAPVVGDNVTLVMSTTTPVTVTSIAIATPAATPAPVTVEGTVVAFVAGTSISVSTKDSAVPTVYTLNSFTTITGLAAGLTSPAVGDTVDLTLSTTTAVVVMSISDLGTPVAPVVTTTTDEDAVQVEGIVTGFAPGISISVQSGDSSTTTLYNLDANTTIAGLATGVTAPAIGDRVHLTLSSATPPVVLTIKDQSSSGEGDSGEGNMGQSNSDHANMGQSNSDHANRGQGKSDHGNWNNSGSSAGSFSNGGFNAAGATGGSSDN